MSGRDSFKKYKPLIKLSIKFLNLFPKVILNILYDVLSIFDGKLSVFYRYCYLYIFTKGKVGDAVYIGRNVTLKNMDGFCCGDNLSIHNNSYIDAYGCISIGNDVSIAHNSSIISFEHDWQDSSSTIKYNESIKNKITIGNNCWLGCGVRVLAGSQVGDKSVIAAGCVVKGSLSSSSIYGGVPAKKIRDIL